MESGESYSRTRWYAVSTRSRQEKVAANTLQALGISHFLPLQLQKRQWSDRVQTIHTPLFPGYLFVHIDPWSCSKLDVLKVPGIARFIGDHTGPLPIDNSEIDSIRSVASCGMEMSPHPYLKQGDRVRVVRGALAGVEGILTSVSSGIRMVISIEVIHRSLAITVSQGDVEPITAESGILQEIA
jgi:transcription termination/antitermination protein NusG